MQSTRLRILNLFAIFGDYGKSQIAMNTKTVDRLLHPLKVTPNNSSLVQSEHAHLGHLLCTQTNRETSKDLD